MAEQSPPFVVRVVGLVVSVEGSEATVMAAKRAAIELSLRHQCRVTALCNGGRYTVEYDELYLAVRDEPQRPGGEH